MDINVKELESEFKKILLQLVNDPFNRELLTELQMIQVKMLSQSTIAANGFKFQTPYSTYLTTNVSQSTTHGSDEASSQIPIIEDNKNVQVNTDDNKNTASNCETCIVEQRSSNIQAQTDCYRRSIPRHLFYVLDAILIASISGVVFGYFNNAIGGTITICVIWLGLLFIFFLFVMGKEIDKLIVKYRNQKANP